MSCLSVVLHIWHLAENTLQKMLCERLLGAGGAETSCFGMKHTKSQREMNKLFCRTDDKKGIATQSQDSMKQNKDDQT